MRAVLAESASLAATLSALVARDADSYAAVSAAYKMPKEPDTAARAARGDRRSAHGRCPRPARDGTDLPPGRPARRHRGQSWQPHAVSDAGVAALLAEAACRGAAYNVRINVAGLTDPALGRGLAEEAERLVGATTHAASIATEEVEKHL